MRTLYECPVYKTRQRGMYTLRIKFVSWEYSCDEEYFEEYSLGKLLKITCCTPTKKTWSYIALVNIKPISIYSGGHITGSSYHGSCQKYLFVPGYLHFNSIFCLTISCYKYLILFGATQFPPPLHLFCCTIYITYSSTILM